MTTQEIPDKKKVSTQIPAIFQNVKTYENGDSRFLKIKIWLMHIGKNLNGSSFSKEVVEKAIPTLANTPLLAFIEENSSGEQDFSDHRMVLHRTTDGEIDLKYLGSAIGVIPENHNAKWETRVTDIGDELEYLTVEALMWNKWDEPINLMKRKGFVSQSMELSDSYSGSWDSENTFHFDKFEFFGACLLGEDVMPAMKNSTAEIQFSKNENIKNTIEDKLQEFYTLFSHEGGTQMTVENVTPEVEEVVETDVQEFEAEAVTTEETATTIEEESDDNSEFEAIEAIEETEVVIVEAIVEDEIEVDVTDYKTEYSSLLENYEALNTDFNNLKEQLDTLQSYKRQREESDIKDKFEGKLSEEEFTQVFTELKDASLDKVEEKLFALIGKKNFSIKKEVNTNINKVVFHSRKDEEVKNPYGDIFES